LQKNAAPCGNVSVLTLTLILSIGLASYIIGSAYLRIIGLGLDIPVRNVFSLAVGWGILAYFAMGLAAVGLLRTEYVAGLLAAIILAGLREWKTAYNYLLSAPASIKAAWTSSNRTEKCLWVALFWLFAWNILDVLAPPSVADSLTYHFRIPYDYLLAGKLIYNPFLPNNSPHLTEIYSVFSFAFNNEISAHAQFYFFNCILAWAIIAFGKRYFNLLTGLLSAVIFFSLPIITNIKSAGYVEIALVLVTFMALWATWEGVHGANSSSIGWFILAGSLFGLACGIKYYGLINLIILSLFLSQTVIRRRIKWGKVRLSGLFYFCLALLIFSSPFYMKNFLFTGNLLYPALYNLFGGIDWTVERNMLFKLMANTDKMPLGHSLWALLTSTWDISMHGILIGGYGTGYGPFYVALFPLFFSGIYKSFDSTQKKLILWASFYLVVFWIIWFFAALQRGRHLLPVFLILTSIFCAFIVNLFRERDKRYKWWKYGVAATLFVCLGFNIAVHGVFNAQFLKVGLGIEAKDSFLSRKLKYYDDMKWANLNLPLNAKVLNYNGAHSYYLKREMAYPSPYFQGHFDFLKYLSVDEYYSQLKKEGFTHIITKYSDAVIDTNDKNDPLKQYMAKYMRLHHELIRKYGVEIYERKGTAPARRTFSDKTRDVCVRIYELG
jgi:hypothetical protein